MREKLREKCVGIYLVVMILVYPLFFRDDYNDIMHAKRDFYLITGGIFLILMLLLEVEKKKWDEERPWKYFYALLLAEVLSLFFATLGCADHKDVFWGLSGRYLGSAAMIMGIFSVYFIGKYMKWHPILNWALILGSGAVCLLQGLNTLGYDPLSMKEDLTSAYYYTFNSTIGNINFNATFDCLAIPVGMVLYLLCKEKRRKWVYAAWLAVCYFGMIGCLSESVYLGVGVAFLVLFGYALGKKEYLERFFDLVGIFTLAVLVWWGLMQARADIHAFLSRGMAHYTVRRAVLLLGLLAFLLGKWFCKRTRYDDFKRFRKGYVAILAFGFLALVALSVRYNASGAEPTGGLSTYLIFNDQWGSGRGYVWKRSFGLFREFDVWDKLFGCGMTGFGPLMDATYGTVDTNGVLFIDAHNEYIQMLVTMGIVGAFAYIGTMVYLLAMSVRAFAKNEEALLGVVGVAAFMAQGMVNNPQIVTTPLMFCEFGIFWHIIRKSMAAT